MENNKKGKIISYVVILVLGSIIGLFGVLISVFSDGTDYERVITMLIILIMYGLVSTMIGIMRPLKTFLYLPWLCLPGVLVLILYMYKEFSLFYVVYMILILVTSYTGLKTGRSFKRPK